jgi:hypothetical protein
VTIASIRSADSVHRRLQPSEIFALALRPESKGAGNSCRNHPAPKDRALKATARLGIATRPDKISSRDFNKSIPILSTLVERVHSPWRAPCSGHRLSGGDYVALACTGHSLAPFWPSSRVRFYNGFLAGTFVDLASSSASRL